MDTRTVSTELKFQRQQLSPSMFFLKEVDGANLVRKPGGYHERLPSSNAWPLQEREDFTDSESEKSPATQLIPPNPGRNPSRGVLRATGSKRSGFHTERSRATTHQGSNEEKPVEFAIGDSGTSLSLGEGVSQFESRRVRLNPAMLTFPEPPLTRGSQRGLASFFILPWNQRQLQERELSNGNLSNRKLRRMIKC
jgi:hypothetical protein